MKLNDKILNLRRQAGMSQEQAAERLKVSRQALSRWENGTAQPAANNIVEISRLFGVTTDYLLNDEQQSDEDIPAAAQTKQVNSILRANLIKIAIIAQAAALNVAIQPIAQGVNPHVVLIFKIVPLLAASIWMACNIRYETDPVQRGKNAKTELLYCCVQAAAALFAYFTKFYFTGAVLLMVICGVYLLKINPRYMNRRLTK